MKIAIYWLNQSDWGGVKSGKLIFLLNQEF